MPWGKPEAVGDIHVTLGDENFTLFLNITVILGKVSIREVVGKVLNME